MQPHCSQILIPVCDHFYDGSLENLALLEIIYQNHPEVQFVEFAYDPEEVYGTPAIPGEREWAIHWHNTPRLISNYFLDPSITHVLFCDVDEIVEGSSFGNWLAQFPLEKYTALRLATYWYFRSGFSRATVHPDGPLLVQKQYLTPENLLNEDERQGLFFALPDPKERLLMGLEGKPMVHHYSWVRSKEELFCKTERWGHHWERDWQLLIEKEFDSPFEGKDFVRGYHYEEVAAYFDPLEVSILNPHQQVDLETHRQNVAQFPNVKLTTPKDIFRKELLAQVSS